MKKKIDLPKLPYGEGSMSWDTKNPDVIVYRKKYTFSNGKTVRVCVTGYTPKECMQNMKDKISHTENKIYQENAQRSNHKGVTLGNGMITWLNDKKGTIKEKTFDRYETTLNNQILKHPIKDKQVYNIAESDIESYVDFLMKSNLSFSSIKKAYILLKQYMNYAYEKNPIKNPMNSVSLPKYKTSSIALGDVITDEKIDKLHDNGIKPVTIKDILTDEEIKIFKKESCKEYRPGVGGYRYGHIFYFMILTFPRVGEMLATRWKDVDFENKVMHIQKGISTVKNRDVDSKTKTKRVITTPKSKNSIRDIMLTDEAIWALEEHKKLMSPKSDEEFICKTVNNSVASDRVLYDSLKLIIKNSGIQKENFSLHNLRHTGISYYIRHKVPIDIIANMAGHDVSVTQKIYYHIIQDQKNTALNIMNSIKI